VLTRDINWMGRIVREEKKGNGHHIVQLNSTKNVGEQEQVAPCSAQLRILLHGLE
jgi:hypothetical protein